MAISQEFSAATRSLRSSTTVRSSVLCPRTEPRYVHLAVLTNYRTSSGHRRYALSELRGFLAARQRPRPQPPKVLMMRQ